MGYWIVDGKEYSEEDYKEIAKQRKAKKEAELIARWEAEQKAQEEAARLMRQVGQAYTAYKDHMSRHPQLGLRVTEGQAADQAIYQQLRENLERADQRPRCRHIKADGLRCGSPRMNGGQLCYTHQRMAASRPQTPPQMPRLPSMMMEDANSIQLSLMEVSRALLAGQITEKYAGKLLYSLQIAASNVHRVTFHEAPQEMVVDEPVVAAEAGDRSEDPFNYEMLDPDLKLKLQELGDEIDRRFCEQRSREKSPENPERSTTEDTEDHGERRETNPESLTTKDTKEHREERGPRIEAESEGLDIAKPPDCETAAGELRESNEGPQGLKPKSFSALYGTAEAVP